MKTIHVIPFLSLELVAQMTNRGDILKLSAISHLEPWKSNPDIGEFEFTATKHFGNDVSVTHPVQFRRVTDEEWERIV